MADGIGIIRRLDEDATDNPLTSIIVSITAEVPVNREIERPYGRYTASH